MSKFKFHLRMFVKNYIFSIISLIAISFFIFFIIDYFFIPIKNYINQDSWIFVEANLEVLTPVKKEDYIIYDYLYQGVHNGQKVSFSIVDESSYLNSNMNFYINPDDYTDYFKEIDIESIVFSMIFGSFLIFFGAIIYYILYIVLCNVHIFYLNIYGYQKEGALKFLEIWDKERNSNYTPENWPFPNPAEYNKFDLYSIYIHNAYKYKAYFTGYDEPQNIMEIIYKCYGVI